MFTNAGDTSFLKQKRDILAAGLRQIESKTLDAVGKRYLSSLHTRSLRHLENPEAAQNRLWLKTRDSLRGTKIYEDLGLASVQSYRDYLSLITPKTYEFYAPYVEKIKQGERNVLFTDELHALIQTSGTTGFNDKLIPFNKALLKSFQSFQTRCFSVVCESSNWNVSLSQGKLALGANPALESANGVSKGYVSGILSTTSPRILRKRFFPSAQTLATENWDQKVALIAQETAGKDIRMLAGVPAHLVNLATDLIKQTGKSSLIDIWPNLQTVVYSGTAVESYERTLNNLAGRNLRYLGLYVASEGPIGYEIPNQKNDGTHQFAFAINDTLLSFVEAENPEGRVLGVHELRAGVDYLVHTGTPNGLLQYCLRDVIRVTKTYPFVTFTVQGRQNQLLNIATEKVSVQQLAATIAGVEASLGTNITHFFVYPRQPHSGKPHYDWLVACDDKQNASDLARELDKHLMNSSGDYQEERMVAKHIGEPRVRIIPTGVISEYFASHRNRGQFKMKTVFSSELEFLRFAKETLPSLQHQEQ